jgi:hypothetical protein
MDLLHGIRKWICYILLLTVYSCILYKRGYIDSNNQYNPKNPNYKLKDKPNLVMPIGLDTVNIYKMKTVYINGKQEYPFLPGDYRYGDVRFDRGINYIKFYSKGRCLAFTIKDNGGNKAVLNENSLNPDNKFYLKGYYYSEDGNIVKVEKFVYGEGNGSYVIFDYNVQGDSLIKNFKNSQEIYIKEYLPNNWKKYKVDW